MGDIVKPATLPRRWFLWNAIAWFTGYLLYTPIAHGVTGGHGRDLRVDQVLAHAIALAVVAVTVAAAQRRALSPHVSIPRVRLVVAALVFNIAFWIGYYQPFVNGPDTDILLGFFALGSVTWVGRISMRGHPLAAAIALGSFPAASIVAELGLILAFSLLGITPALQTSGIQHSVFWVAVGGVTGTLGGWLSGLALVRGRFPGQPNQHLELPAAR
jgi:hypothetical protein